MGYSELWESMALCSAQRGLISTVNFIVTSGDNVLGDG